MAMATDEKFQFVSITSICLQQNTTLYLLLSFLKLYERVSNFSMHFLPSYGITNLMPFTTRINQRVAKLLCKHVNIGLVSPGHMQV